MYCQKCGKENTDDSNFCIGCGEMLADSADIQKFDSYHEDTLSYEPSPQFQTQSDSLLPGTLKEQQENLDEDKIHNEQKIELNYGEACDTYSNIIPQNEKNPTLIALNYKKIIILTAIAVTGFILAVIGINQIISLVDVNNVKALVDKKDWQAIEEYILDAKNAGKKTQRIGLVGLINDADSWFHLTSIMTKSNDRLRLNLGELLQENEAAERFERYVGNHAYTLYRGSKEPDLRSLLSAFSKMNPKDENARDLAELSEAVRISENRFKNAEKAVEKAKEELGNASKLASHGWTIRVYISHRIENSYGLNCNYAISFENGTLAALVSFIVDDSWLGKWHTIYVSDETTKTNVTLMNGQQIVATVYAHMVSPLDATEAAIKKANEAESERLASQAQFNTNASEFYDKMRNWRTRIRAANSE